MLDIHNGGDEAMKPTLTKSQRTDGDHWVGTNIVFEQRPAKFDKPKAKTRYWFVDAKADKDPPECLGCVKWFGRWRTYAFFPEPFTVFEKVCLLEIAEFCEARTREHSNRTHQLAREKRAKELLPAFLLNE